MRLLHEEKNTIRYFTKTDLIHANNAAFRENRNNRLDKESLKRLPEGLYPITEAYEHSKDEVRVVVNFFYNEMVGLIDISMFRYKSLPTAKFNADGTTEFESDASIQSKKPYGTEREWEEKTVRKPVRNQNKFRKDILSAYGNQCSVCFIRKVSLLRAAHIIPVIISGDDTTKNGLCLCVLHEIAYDNGILKITAEGKIEIVGDEEIKVDFTHIRFPLNLEFHPSPNNLSWRYMKRK